MYDLNPSVITREPVKIKKCKKLEKEIAVRVSKILNKFVRFMNILDLITVVRSRKISLHHFAANQSSRFSPCRVGMGSFKMYTWCNMAGEQRIKGDFPFVSNDS